jgi:hypothetical protein
MRGETERKWAYLAPFWRLESIFFNDLGGKHLAPKAEVTGSNPVGCANLFNGLNQKLTLQKLPFPDYIQINYSRAVLGTGGNCPTRGVHLYCIDLFSGDLR